MTYYTPEFAAFYDHYYTAWTKTFAPQLARFLVQSQIADRSILDLCCGTGVAASIFCDAGWKVFGVDQSVGMLTLARERLRPMIEIGNVILLEAEATDFALPHPVGACVCLDGALNHLQSLSELERCFASVSAALLSGGQFVFDLFEPNHFLHWHHIALIDEPNAVVAKRGVWDDHANQGMLRVSGVFGRGPTCLRVEQTLRSRTFSSTEVESALANAGLSRVEPGIETSTAGMRPEATWTQMESDGSLSHAPARMIYRARKPLKSDTR